MRVNARRRRTLLIELDNPQSPIRGTPFQMGTASDTQIDPMTGPSQRRSDVALRVNGKRFCLIGRCGKFGVQSAFGSKGGLLDLKFPLVPRSADMKFVGDVACEVGRNVALQADTHGRMTGIRCEMTVDLFDGRDQRGEGRTGSKWNRSVEAAIVKTFTHCTRPYDDSLR